MASALALSVAAPTRTEAQTSAAEAYQRAQQAGTIQALERFIEQYPLSDEASEAFLRIVTIARQSGGTGGPQRSLGDLAPVTPTPTPAPAGRS